MKKNLIPQLDATLLSVDAALEHAAEREAPRPHLGMSLIGDECWAKIFYTYRWADIQRFDAKSLKRFEDGHRSEAVLAERLRMVKGIELYTIDPTTGGQFRVETHGGHFSGGMDGVILGLLHDPKTPHVWEAKSVGQDVFDKLTKVKAEAEPDQVLLKWNPNYYAQAVLYMHHNALYHHYTTVTLAGARETQSVITHANELLAEELTAKAANIISAQHRPERISDDPTFWKCKGCAVHDVCHGYRMPLVNCRTCTHSTPDMKRGGWHCERHGKMLTTAEQLVGCDQHTYLPSLLEPYGFTPVDANDGAVTYLTKGMRSIVIGPGENAMPSTTAAKMTPIVADELLAAAERMHGKIGEDGERDAEPGTVIARAEEVIGLIRLSDYGQLSAQAKKKLDRGEATFEPEGNNFVCRDKETGKVLK